MTRAAPFDLSRYRQLLRQTEKWFSSLKEKYADSVRCGRGCSQCCYGLFDVSLPDAFVIAAAFGALPEGIRSKVSDRARGIQQRIENHLAPFSEPFLLDAVLQDRIDEIVDAIPDVPCPFLGSSSECLIYENRPLACRLEGFPMIDAQDGLFGDWCELNFVEGLPPESSRDFRLDYYEMQAVEREATRSLSRRLCGRQVDEAAVFIPSVIASHPNYELRVTNEALRD